MKKTQALVVTLLKSAITGQAQPLPEGYDLTLALQIARRHQVVAMVYQGAVLCGIDPGQPQMQYMFQLSCRAIQNSENQMTWAQKLFRAFDEGEIDYLPLKGCRMKTLYPKPEMRTMGDADILIRMEQYEKIVPIMEALGFAQEGECDHHIGWERPELNVELHRRLVPASNQDYFAYYGDGWQFAKEKTGTQYSMTTEDTFIYIFTHFAKHFRSGGAGYRYITDLWVYMRQNPAMNQDYILGEMKKLDMAAFYTNVRRLVAYWFEDGPGDDLLEWMGQYIGNNGTWGSLESKARVGSLKENRKATNKVAARFVHLWNIVFLDAEAMASIYPVLKKAPWLLPIMWIRRAFRKVFLERGVVDKTTQGLRALTRESIQEQADFFDAVGLHYE